MTSDMDTEDDAELCTWEVYIGSLETPPEYCDLEIESGEDYCLRHQAMADAVEGL